MLNCKIQFNGKELTVEEFRDFVLENGLGALLDGEAPSSLASSLISRYDHTKRNESISEL